MVATVGVNPVEHPEGHYCSSSPIESIATTSRLLHMVNQLHRRHPCVEATEVAGHLNRWSTRAGIPHTSLSESGRLGLAPQVFLRIVGGS